MAYTDIHKLIKNLKADLNSVFIILEEQYKKDFENIPDKDFAEHLKEHLKIRYDLYLTMADETENKLQTFEINEKYLNSFNRNLNKIGKQLLKKILFISDFKINKQAKKVFLSGIKEEHKLFFRCFKDFESNLRKEVITHGSRTIMGKTGPG